MAGLQNETTPPLSYSYIKDSTDLLQELQNLYIPPGAKLFTADAIAMYTNINTEMGINTIENILFNHQNMIPTQFPKEFFLTTLKLVMENNIFSFSDTFWIQLLISFTTRDL
jgi:hypothetical protein